MTDFTNPSSLPIPYQLILASVVNEEITLPANDITNFITLLNYTIDDVLYSNFNDSYQECGVSLHVVAQSYDDITWPTWRRRFNAWGRIVHSGYIKLRLHTAQGGIFWLPRQLLHQVLQETQSLQGRRRNTVVRLFLYLFRNDLVFEGLFQASESTIAAELQLDVMTVSRNLKWLIEHHLVERSGKYMFSGENPFGYAYAIKKEMLD